MIKVISIVAFICSLAFPAEARKERMSILAVCMERSLALKLLKKDYNEEVSSLGITNNGFLLELTLSPSKDTWTLLLHKPYGDSCVVFSGENWRDSDRGPGA